MYLWFAFILLLIFIYMMYSKITSKHTIGLHRDPSNVRRRHRDVPDYSKETSNRILVS